MLVTYDDERHAVKDNVRGVYFDFGVVNVFIGKLHCCFKGRRASIDVFLADLE